MELYAMLVANRFGQATKILNWRKSTVVMHR